MKRLNALTLAAGLAFASSAAQAALVNAGFETGNFSGWSVTIPPGGAANVQSTPGAGGITPFAGAYMAQLKTDGPGSFTTLSQSISLSVGGDVSGHVNWYDAELASNQPAQYNDTVMVQILNSANAVVATPFFDQHSGNTQVVNGWQLWSFVASAADTYKVVYKITNGGDSIVDSFAYFDNIPEPASTALFGLGLLGLGFLRRRKA